MHWFWRAAIAVTVGSIYGGLAVAVFGDVHEAAADYVADALFGGPGPPPGGVAISIAWFLPVILLAFVVFGLLTRWLGSGKPTDSECRCRRCSYILRGISEPRCPECGERI